MERQVRKRRRRLRRDAVWWSQAAGRWTGDRSSPSAIRPPASATACSLMMMMMMMMSGRQLAASSAHRRQTWTQFQQFSASLISPLPSKIKRATAAIWLNKRSDISGTGHWLNALIYNKMSTRVPSYVLHCQT